MSAKFTRVVAGFPAHIIGFPCGKRCADKDASQQGDMPKSGFSANSQAKVCANAVRGALTDSRVFPAKFANTCWSLIAPNDGVKVGATYEATDEKIAKVDGFISQTGETAEVRKATYQESEGWYTGITNDMLLS